MSATDQMTPEQRLRHELARLPRANRWGMADTIYRWAHEEGQESPDGAVWEAFGDLIRATVVDEANVLSLLADDLRDLEPKADFMGLDDGTDEEIPGE